MSKKQVSDVPVIALPAGQGKAHTKKPAKAKVKSKPAKTKSRVKARPTNIPPVGMTPPEMTDTRPLPKPDPLFTEEQAAIIDSHNKSVLDAMADMKSPFQPAKPVVPGGAMVMGSTCTWRGTMNEAVDDKQGVPVCPFCGGRLITAPDLATQRSGFNAFEMGLYPPTPTHMPRAHPGYVKLVEWMSEQPTCWENPQSAAMDYQAQTGIKVDPAL
jgi:hypothetical protein